MNRRHLYFLTKSLKSDILYFISDNPTRDFGGKMEKNIDIIINTIIIFFIISISLLTIANNLKQALQGTIYLTINQDNREYIESTLNLKDSDSKGTLTKIVGKDGFGEWFLYLFYENGEEELVFNDVEMYKLRNYMKENGHDEGKSSETKIWISLGAIILAASYAIMKNR